MVLALTTLIGGGTLAATLTGHDLLEWLQAVQSLIANRRGQDANGGNPVSIGDVNESEVTLEIHEHHHYSNDESSPKEQIADNNSRFKKDSDKQSNSFEQNLE